MENVSTPVVFFDIGTTLMAGPTLTPARQIATVLGLNDTTRRQLNRRLLMTSGVETPAVLAALLAGVCSVPEETVTNLAATVWRSQIEVPEAIRGGVELLSALRAAGVRYGFISNIWFPYATTFLQLYGPLAESDLTFFSFRLGLAKPDPDVFRQAITAAGGLSQACIMVGDSYDSDMCPAIALGMRTVWILHRPEQEQTELEGIKRKELPAPDRMVSSLAGLDVATLTGCPHTGEERSYETDTLGISIYGRDVCVVASGAAQEAGDAIGLCQGQVKPGEGGFDRGPSAGSALCAEG